MVLRANTFRRLMGLTGLAVTTYILLASVADIRRYIRMVTT